MDGDGALDARTPKNLPTKVTTKQSKRQAIPCRQSFCSFIVAHVREKILALKRYTQSTFTMSFKVLFAAAIGMVASVDAAMRADLEVVKLWSKSGDGTFTLYVTFDPV